MRPLALLVLLAFGGCDKPTEAARAYHREQNAQAISKALRHPDVGRFKLQPISSKLFLFDTATGDLFMLDPSTNLFDRWQPVGALPK